MKLKSVAEVVTFGLRWGIWVGSFGRVKIHNPTEFITDTTKSYWLLDPSSSPLGFFVSLLQPSLCCCICFRSLSKLLCRSKRCCSTAALIVLSKMLKRIKDRKVLLRTLLLHWSTTQKGRDKLYMTGIFDGSTSRQKETNFSRKAMEITTLHIFESIRFT